MTRLILAPSDFLRFFLVWWIGVFVGVFGEIGVLEWCFCGQGVVKRVGKVDCERLVFLA